MKLSGWVEVRETRGSHLMSWRWEIESVFKKQEEGSVWAVEGGQENQEPKAILPNTWHQ